MQQAPLHPKLEHPTDDFLSEVLPDWLRRASAAQVMALRDAYKAHLRSQAEVSAVFRRLEPVDTFARRLLAEAFYQEQSVLLDLDSANWREQRRRFKVETGKLPTDESYFVKVPALQRLMQNFASGESFYMETALVYPPIPGTDVPERIALGDAAQIVSVCRRTDVGARYQEHLAQLFTPAFQQSLANSLRQALALQLEIAATRGLLPPAEAQIVRDVVAGRAGTLQNGRMVRCGPLQVLGCTLHAALVVELGSDDQRHAGSVLLVLSDDAHAALRHLVSWRVINFQLVEMFKDPARCAALVQRISLRERAGFLTTLAKRLADEDPDLEPTFANLPQGQFEGLALQQLERIREDARFLAVPTADADSRQALEREQSLASAGLALLNLAGLFVPAIGALLLADMVTHTLSEVYEGVRHWTLGHQHEALEHLLGVAENLAVTAAVAAGGALVARGFVRSTFVDGLEPITNVAGRQRLWSNDLSRYQGERPSATLYELDNGLHTDGVRHWWLHGGKYWRVRALGEHGPWRLQYPTDETAFGPSLERNTEVSWQLFSERPLEWQGAQMLLQRLWPASSALGSERVAQVLKVADVSQEHLRGLLVEKRPLPVALRDTLERFSADDRIERFFAHLGRPDSELWQWCLDDLGLQTLSRDEQVEQVAERAASLRPRLLEYLAGRYLKSDSLGWLIQRDFPGLPDAYALHVLQHITAGQRVALRTQARLPLAVAQHARQLLQVARLTRMREGLYLAGSHHPGLDELVFCLLREHAGWPAATKVELREGSTDGRRLACLPEPEQAGVNVVMVRHNGRYRLYDVTGTESQARAPGPLELDEALLACLPVADRRRLGWHGDEALTQIRLTLQRWLPQGREALLELLGARDVGAPQNPIRRLPDGRVGYLLSGRGAGGNAGQQLMRARIRSLYPGFNDQEVQTFLGILLEQPGSALGNLLRQEQQYHRFSEALTRWVEGTRTTASQSARLLVADELRRSWRLIGEHIVDQHGASQGMRLSLTGVPLRSLPELPVDTDFAHVAELVLSDLALEHVPATFLRCFSQLRWLNLSDNRLTEVPAELMHLSHLTNLRLAGNQIRMTAAGVAALGNLTRLRILDLNHNPLGAIALQLDALGRLRELHMRGANLQTVPAQLHRCRLLELVDLRDNHIGALPEMLLEAPEALRMAVRLSGNPLSNAVRQRMLAAGAVGAAVDAQLPAVATAREQWLALVEAPRRGISEAHWDGLQGEGGSDEFFGLLKELTSTRDYQLIPADLGRRVWTMLEAMHSDTVLREELFNLAADSRTCADSVAACFSALEVRLYLRQALQQDEPLAARLTRLRVARQLFRLEQVERLAREDVQARVAQGQTVDEIEVSLAYRTGLAVELELPGQPRTMQFSTIADVSQQQLAVAAAAVREAEGSDQLVRFVTQRDFWREYLQREQPATFSAVEEPFSERLEALSGLAAGGEGAYLVEVDRLTAERRAAIEALVLRLTQEAMGVT
ncbi:NEL-type E3 ubiquitin ligase domain-containing protein [Pseudomonas soli]|uniref:NEL-type E3 ubiquitin ligase domain-containing protein n=1 Tax=Pseudomonas soli TaxID=1306993 RepID=UPI0028B1E24E|nr:NEL-type E3 ubiquitin ligase domain-containing protein [Pseudomonas soli]